MFAESWSRDQVMQTAYFKSVISYCFLIEKSLCLSTKYKTKEFFMHLSYYNLFLWLASLRWRITQFARESVGLCPFRGSCVREFELSHGNPVKRIIKITHTHNLHVKRLDFGLFTIRTWKKRNLFNWKFSLTILRHHLGLKTSAIKLCFMQRH